MSEFATLITGPSGTGKELVARSIALSRDVPFDESRLVFEEDLTGLFFPINIAALPGTLVESELFGHKRGSFTGAVQDKRGWLEACPPLGAVFLDEIGDLDPEIQVKLLRVIETRSFQALGESNVHARRFQGKLIAATNRNFASAIRKGRFREDLYYRLCSDLIVTPSLRRQIDESPGVLRDLILFMSKRVAGQVTTPGVPPLVLAGQWRDAFFVSDKWDVLPKLTLTMGVRYELPTVPESPNGHIRILSSDGTMLLPTEVPGAIPLIEPQYSAFAPRFGFAYRLTKNWVVRGGAGIYYNANQMNTYTLGGGNPPFSTRLTYNSSAATLLTLADPVSANSLGPTRLPNISTVSPYLPLATMNQWSFDVERSLWSGAGLDVQYLGSHTYNLDQNFYNNTPFLPGPRAVNSRRPNPLWGVVRTVQNNEIANYDGLSIVLRQRFYHGLSFLASYTWSHTLDVGTDSNNAAAGASPQNPYNWRADYSNSNWDIRDRFVASYTYEIPSLKRGSVWGQSIATNWQLNGITTIQSGTPFTVTIPGDLANTGVTPQRPNLIGRARANCGGGHLTNCITSAAFAVPAAYAYGNANRNILYGPGLATTDFSLFRNFSLHAERVRLQIRAEAFNVFNTPSFNNPSAVLGTTTFGTVTSTLIPNRQVQFGAKIIF